MIQMTSAIEEHSGLATREPVGMLKESASFVLQFKAQDGGPEQVPICAMVTSGGTSTPM